MTDDRETLLALLAEAREALGDIMDGVDDERTRIDRLRTSVAAWCARDTLSRIDDALAAEKEARA